MYKQKSMKIIVIMIGIFILIKIMIYDRINLINKFSSDFKEMLILQGFLKIINRWKKSLKMP